jgi:hypothetical protein
VIAEGCKAVRKCGGRRSEKALTEQSQKPRKTAVSNFQRRLSRLFYCNVRSDSQAKSPFRSLPHPVERKM